MHPFITYSLLAACAALLAAGIWVEGRKEGMRGAKLRRYALPAQIGAVLLAYFALRPGHGDNPSRVMAASAAAGKPLLVDVYSNW